VILAYHIIFSAYGFWLPNDPRGSWSNKVWAEHLKPFGDAQKVTTRQSIAGAEHDRRSRLEAKRSLRYPAVRFNGVQAREVARGIEDAGEILELAIHACAVMPDHVHLVTARHRQTAESIAGFLKRAATRRLSQAEIHPLARFRSRNGRVPSPWVRGGWFVYLNTPEHVRHRIAYVNDNPIKAGFKRQRWSFVKPLETPRSRDG